MPPGPLPHLEQNFGLGPHHDVSLDKQKDLELLEEIVELKKDKMVIEARYTTLLYVCASILTENLN